MHNLVHRKHRSEARLGLRRQEGKTWNQDEAELAGREVRGEVIVKYIQFPSRLRSREVSADDNRGFVEKPADASTFQNEIAASQSLEDVACGRCSITRGRGVKVLIHHLSSAASPCMEADRSADRESSSHLK
jgi:hypothetical protein